MNKNWKVIVLVAVILSLGLAVAGLAWTTTTGADKTHAANMDGDHMGAMDGDHLGGDHMGGDHMGGDKKDKK